MEVTTIPSGAEAASESLWSELRFRFAARYRVVWVALAALLVLSGVTESEMFKPQSLEFITALAGVLAIAAAGQMLVIMLGGIDLSVPAVMALAGAIVVKQTQGADDQLLVAILEGCAAAAVIGLVNGALVVFAKLNAFIVTLAMNGVVLGAIVIWAGSVYSASGAAPKGLIDFTSNAVGPITIFGLLALVLLFAIGFLLRTTGVGRAYVATGTNPNAARIIGIHTRTHQIGGFVVASILFMVAGILLAGVVRTPNIVVGETYQLTTIVAVALGGASLAGGPASALCTGAACLFVAVLSQFLTLGDFEPGIKVLANGVVLVLAVVLVTSGTGHRPSLSALLERVRFRGLRGTSSDPGEPR